MKPLIYIFANKMQMFNLFFMSDSLMFGNKRPKKASYEVHCVLCHDWII